MMTDDLYPGVQVDFTRPNLRRNIRTARLWKIIDFQALCIAWLRPNSLMVLLAVGLDSLRISEQADEAPEMPWWTDVETPFINPGIIVQTSGRQRKRSL
jgi:hypothetical protein